MKKIDVLNMIASGAAGIQKAFVPTVDIKCDNLNDEGYKPILKEKSDTEKAAEALRHFAEVISKAFPTFEEAMQNLHRGSIRLSEINAPLEENTGTSYVTVEDCEIYNKDSLFAKHCREWLKGCGSCEKGHPEQCKECTDAFLQAVKKVGGNE
jgi:hypothetical protein